MRARRGFSKGTKGFGVAKRLQTMTNWRQRSYEKRRNQSSVEISTILGRFKVEGRWKNYRKLLKP
jgi:hypothetical protein